MRPPFLLDTNVIIRFLTQDDAAQLERSERLIGPAENGKGELLLRACLCRPLAHGLLSALALIARRQEHCKIHLVAGHDYQKP